MRRQLTTAAAVAAGVALLVTSAAPDPTQVGAEYEPAKADSQPGPVVLDLVDDTSPADVEALSQALGVTLSLSSPWSADEGLYRAIVADPAGLIARLQGHPLVEVAEPVIEVEAYGYPDDPMWDRQWNMQVIGSPVGWRVGGGEGVKVAVIDTGVKLVEDLEGVDVVSGKSFVPGAATADDDHGHGTHVAGTIAQATNNGVGVTGVAPNATIVPYKVLSKSGSGASDWVAAAVDEAVDAGVDVINMSLGGGNSKVLAKAVEAAVDAGVIVVAAAGNTGKKGVGCPANVEGVIAVSAVGPDDGITWYSTYGPEVEIAAPGGDLKKGEASGILQDTIDGKGGHAYRAFQGTSMATPHVAGAAAVLLGMGLDDSAATAVLLETAHNPTGERTDQYVADLKTKARVVVHEDELSKIEIAAESASPGGKPLVGKDPKSLLGPVDVAGGPAARVSPAARPNIPAPPVAAPGDR